MDITIEMLKEMNEEEIEFLECDILERLSKLDDIKTDYELYYDLDDDINLECYHEAIKEIDELYNDWTIINRYYNNKGECC